MPLSINTNISSLQADRQIARKDKALGASFEKLASGKEINKASDNPAGLAVALSLLTESDTSVVAARNISDGVSVANIAEGSLSTASDITGRLSELAVQASNGTLSDSQRQALNSEFQSLRSELDRISQTTEFNGQKLLSQDSSISLQAGTGGDANSQIALNLIGVSSSNLGLSADLSTQEGARAALEQTKAATATLAASRGEIGSSVSRLNTAYENLKTSEVNTREAASRIQDADIAQETANLIANRIGQQAAIAVKVQANLQPAQVMKLLG